LGGDSTLNPNKGRGSDRWSNLLVVIRGTGGGIDCDMQDPGLSRAG
jgi:hypothetical protein